MPVTGDFHTMPLTDVLEWIAGARRSGLLRVSLAESERAARIRHGAVASFGSNDLRRDNFGHLLASRGMIDLVELERLIVRQRDTERPLMDLLLQEGKFAAAELARLLDESARELLYDLLLWEEGRFTFVTESEGEAAAPTPAAMHELHEPIDVREILFDAVRVQDEWKRIREVLPGERTVVRRRPDATEPATDAPYLERRLFAAAASARSVAALALETGCSMYAVLRALHALWERGHIQVRRAAPDSARPHGALDDLLRGAETLLAERQFEEAALVYGAALNLDPEDGRARAGLARVRAAQVAQIYERVGPAQLVVRVPYAEAAAGIELGPREKTVLDHIDGSHPVQVLVALSTLPELEALRALERLRDAGLVVIG
ncbi:MAG TPA: DUF4388 domain-containing protein [Myxococcota bacterium]|nr:DUF4388 domain-containing protein [Myxococcota bacterium]